MFIQGLSLTLGSMRVLPSSAGCSSKRCLARLANLWGSSTLEWIEIQITQKSFTSYWGRHTKDIPRISKNIKVTPVKGNLIVLLIILQFNHEFLRLRHTWLAEVNGMVGQEVEQYHGIDHWDDVGHPAQHHGEKEREFLFHNHKCVYDACAFKWEEAIYGTKWPIEEGWLDCLCLTETWSIWASSILTEGASGKGI